MADFRTHVTTSSVLGVGYAGMGVVLGIPLETSLVAGGLCGVSGMLPDLDSDTGIPVREAMGFGAAVVPMLLVDRFQALGLPYDQMVLLTAGIYFFIRFAGASLVTRFSVHRGMFHSIPAALIFAGLAFLIVGYTSLEVRYFKAGAVFFGVLSHLLLDELYSVEWKGGTWRFKRSFGTALKFWSNNGWANFSTYAKLAVVVLMITSEPSVMRQLSQRNPRLAERLQQVHGYQDQLLGTLRHGLEEPSDVTATSPPVLPLPPHAPAAVPVAPQPVSPIPATAPLSSSPPLSTWQPQPWQPQPWQTLPGQPPRSAAGFPPNAGAPSPFSR